MLDDVFDELLVVDELLWCVCDGGEVEIVDGFDVDVQLFVDEFGGVLEGGWVVCFGDFFYLVQGLCVYCGIGVVESQFVYYGGKFSVDYQVVYIVFVGVVDFGLEMFGGVVIVGFVVKFYWGMKCLVFK